MSFSTPVDSPATSLDNNVLPDLAEYAPLGLMELDASRAILYLNTILRSAYGLRVGDDFLGYVHTDHRPAVQHFLDQAMDARDRQEITCSLTINGGQFAVLITGMSIDERQYYWIQDRSVLSALQTQLRQTRSPQRQLLKQLRQISTTALGYGELIDMILDDDEALTKTAHQNIRRHHKQLMQQLLALTGIANDGDTKPNHDSVTRAANTRAHILVVDDEVAVSRVLTELLLAKGYKVTSFSSANNAMKAVRVNPHIFSLAIVDHHMPGIDGVALAEQLHQVRLPVILCTASDQVPSTDAIQRIVHKPIDIHQLNQVVAETIDVAEQDA